MTPNYTESAGFALKIAEEVACNFAEGNIGTGHILMGLMLCDGTSAQILEANGIDRVKIMDNAAQMTDTGKRAPVMDGGKYTPRALKLLDDSEKEAKRLKSNVIGTEHILIAILKSEDCVAYKLIESLDMNKPKIYMDCMVALGYDTTTARNEYIHEKSKKNGKAKSLTPVLDKNSRDLTRYAKEGRLDPVIGRDREIQSIIQILSRRMKNNPCLIGEPGVGKTAIAEGLAMRIVDKNVPDMLIGKRVVTLDMSGMVAGTKYRGEFEEKMKKLLKEVMTDGNILLFIDEMHTIIGAGGAESAIDASNIIKPFLARGELQIIGATTTDEYRKNIEKDAALERRFQPVMVEEPDELKSISILKGLRPRYEKHHNVVITDEAVDAAVKLTVRYVNDRFLPDKAIDAMDEAASKVRINKISFPPEIREYEKKRRELNKEKEEALKREDYEKASEIKREQDEIDEIVKKFKDDIEKNKEKDKIPEVTGDDIADVIADWTKIPVKRLKQDETERLKNLEEILHKRVVGQKEAVNAVAKAVRRGRIGLKNPMRPTGSFLFLGPTGVGKTELSKALAEAVFGDENEIIRVDMSEYMEKHTVSKMIGSPPGYVGYEEGGQLSERVRRKPYSVILFDEIEKAHPDVFNILLQILEDGHVTDSHGRRVSFKDTVIIMTSNAGAQRIITPKLLGFSSSKDEAEDYKRMKSEVMEEVKRIFKPEFLNRIDEILVFHSLTKENIKEISRILIANLADRIKEQLGITLEIDEQVYDHIAANGFDKDYGARPVRRAIQTDIEDALADEMIEGRICRDSKVRVSCEADKITFAYSNF